MQHISLAFFSQIIYGVGLRLRHLDQETRDIQSERFISGPEAGRPEARRSESSFELSTQAKNEARAGARSGGYCLRLRRRYTLVGTKRKEDDFRCSFDIEVVEAVTLTYSTIWNGFGQNFFCTTSTVATSEHLLNTQSPTRPSKESVRIDPLYLYTVSQS